MAVSGKLPRCCVVFRVDGSSLIGTGHVMRCLTLANMMAQRGIECLFLMRNFSPALISKVEAGGHTVVTMPNHAPAPVNVPGLYAGWLGTTEDFDARESATAILGSNATPPALIVVDHYGLGEAWEREIIRQVGAPILAIDDLDRRHVCDFLLDATFGKNEDAYRNLVPQHCDVMVGALFALVRPEFRQLRTRALQRRDRLYAENSPVQDILISMGGADVADATGWTVDGLIQYCKTRGIRIHALVGSEYAHLEALDARRAQTGETLQIQRDIPDVATLLAASDVCVGASGSSVWERCCLGLPAVNVILAENQLATASNLSNAGIVLDGGTFDAGQDPLAWASKHLLPFLNPEQMRVLSNSARNVVDGYGVIRVLNVVLKDWIRRASIHLRKAESRDIALVYEWQCHPQTRRYALNPAVPSWAEHSHWMRRKLEDETSSFYICDMGGVAAGVVRLDVSKAEAPSIDGIAWREISILTAPEFYGCGVAARALHALKNAHSHEGLIARVLTDNAASQSLFAKGGFNAYAPEHLYWYQP